MWLTQQLSERKNLNFSLEIRNIVLFLITVSTYGGAAFLTTLHSLEFVQKKAITLIADPTLSSKLRLLAHNQAVGDLFRFLSIFP